MKLLIHAGIHRTGTSSLQDFLTSNRDALLQRRILYPGDLKNHQRLAWAIKRGKADSSELIALLEQEADTHDTVVLSAEDFCIHKNLTWLAEVAAKVPTSVHFYLRRQDHWLMSWYNQHVKWPFDPAKSQMTPREFLHCLDDFYWINFDQLVSGWEAVLGKESVHVAVVEPGQVEDVTVDFIRHIGLGEGDLPTPAKRANDSMPVHLLEVVRHMGLHDLLPGQRVKVISSLKRAHPAPADLPKTVYSPKERCWILDRFAESNQHLALRRFDRNELFLEPRPDPSAPYHQFVDLPKDDFIRQWIKPLVHDLVKK